jgi:hypothetical protein
VGLYVGVAAAVGVGVGVILGMGVGEDGAEVTCVGDGVGDSDARQRLAPNLGVAQPPGVCLPTGHFLQVFLLPSWSVYLPGVHAAQALYPTALKWPGAHFRQPTPNRPALQGLAQVLFEYGLCSLSPNLPAAHVPSHRALTPPVLAAKRPAGQSLHDFCPALSTK